MTEKTKAPASDFFDQALKNYEQALRAGLKAQEEAAAYWTKLFNQTASRSDVQKQFTSVANDVIPPAQKYMESCVGLVEQNSRAGVELVKKGIDAAQTSDINDLREKLMDITESSLKSVKATAQAFIEMNSKAMDSWVGVMKKATEVAETRLEKA